MLAAVLLLLACSTPEPAADLPVVPVEDAVPKGSIGGEPILPNAVVLGAISADAVHRGVASRAGAIAQCFASARASDPSLSGKVLLKFTIVEDGTVQTAIVKSTSLRSPNTEYCLTEQIRQVQFPALASGPLAIVHYPFVFPAS